MLYQTDSKMGGVFNVKVLSVKDGVAKVKVHSPRNPDWHGWETYRSVKSLTKIEEK